MAQPGIGDTDRRPEGPGNNAKLMQHPLSGLNLHHQTPGTSQHEQIVMMIGMVTDLVTLGQDVPNQFGMGGCPLPGHKKSGLHIVAGKGLEQCRCGKRVRPVIKRDGHCFFAGVSAAYNRQKKTQPRQKGGSKTKDYKKDQRKGKQSSSIRYKRIAAAKAESPTQCAIEKPEAIWPFR